MVIDKDRQRGESELFRAKIRKDARKDEDSNVGIHCSQLGQSRRNWPNSKTVQVNKKIKISKG